MLGWSVEVIYAFVKTKKFINRGFLYGPFCPIYGVGVIVIYSLSELITNAFIGKPPSLITIFMITTVITTLLELVTGATMSTLFHTKWWDYSERKFNYRGYICLEFSILWGAAGTGLLWFVHPVILNWVEWVPKATGEAVLLAFSVYLIMDGTATIRSLIDFKVLLKDLETISSDYITTKSGLIEELLRLKEELSEKLKNGVDKKTEEASIRLKKIQNHIKAFQLNGQLPSNPLKSVISELMDEEFKVDIKSKFELKSLQENYEKLTLKLFKSRLYNAFPDMKSRKYREILKELRQRKGL
jgi:uncharacterized membrane protein